MIKEMRLDDRASMEKEGITDTFPFSKYYLERCVGCGNYDECIKDRSAMILCANCLYYRWQIDRDEESMDARFERVKDECETKAKEKELQVMIDRKVGIKELMRWIKKTEKEKRE